MSKPASEAPTIKDVLHLPTYFDFSAATPAHPEVLREMMPYFSHDFYNPSALYGQGREAKNVLEKARASVARSLGAKPAEIIFTAGGSESIALALHGVMRKPENKDACVVISGIEHDAVRRTAHEYRSEVVGVDHTGVVILQDLEDILNSDSSVALISIIYASNEIGTIQDISTISKLIRSHNLERRKQGRQEVLLHIDASQAPLYLDCNPARLGVDLMTLNGGKIYGPKQSGMLYVRTGVELTPLLRGGGQEFGLRSGTENVAFAVGFAKALEMATRGREERALKTAQMRDYLMGALEDIEGSIFGHRTKRVANNVLVGFEGADNETLQIKLDALGFAVAIGSACHASSGEPSEVLRAIGVSEEMAQSTIRLSINEYTSKKDCDKLIQAIKSCL